jgi:actin-like ATPase involved in cell morphogenesis
MMMSYRLGIDLGTTFTAAAVARDGKHTVAELMPGRYEIPSTVCLGPDGRLVIGDEAERLGEQRPTALAREFKRRLGDQVPLIIDGRMHSPQTLMAHQLRWVVDRVASVQGSLPELLAVTCPANWGPYKHDLLRQVIRMAEVPSAIVCTEPEAAAIRHAGADAQREGALVGVYDLGGGTFDAAVLRATRTGAFALAGPPEGIEHMGGIDFDEAIYAFTVEALGHDAPDLARSDDPAVVAALARVRRRCVTAKEALSVDHVAEVAIDLPGLTRAVRITRGEFESMVRSALDDTIRAFERAIRNAGTSAADLASVVLVGGSVRIPLVFESISRRLDCQVIMPRNPSHSVALGAAMAAERYRPAVGVPRGSARAARPAGGSSPAVALSSADGSGREDASNAAATDRLAARDATVTVRELLHLPPDRRAVLKRWLVGPGQPIGLGRPLAEVELRRGSGGSASAMLVALRSPFDGVVHRTFVAEGAELRPEDLLVGYRQVSAFLDRSGRTQAIDVGVRIAVPAPMSATAEAGRPVVFVDRVPRGIWWSATFCLLTEPGDHLIGVGYTRGNSWFGVATCEVIVGDRGLVDIVYTDPGLVATAVLEPVTPPAEAVSGRSVASAP